MSSNGDVQRSYNWLLSYLRSRYEQKFLCHEISNRSVTKPTNLNELEDWASEAASCPKEHLMKHFMLEACSYNQRQMMKPYLLFPMNEFKLKLKSVVQEETRRFHGHQSNNNVNSNRVNAIQKEEQLVDEGISEKPENSAKPFREFRRSSPVQGNEKA